MLYPLSSIGYVVHVGLYILNMVLTNSISLTTLNNQVMLDMDSVDTLLFGERWLPYIRWTFPEEERTYERNYEQYKTNHLAFKHKRVLSILIEENGFKKLKDVQIPV